MTVLSTVLGGSQGDVNIAVQNVTDGVTGLQTANGGTALGDNLLVRGDGATGIQGSIVTVSDTGQITGDLVYTQTSTGTSGTPRVLTASESGKFIISLTPGADNYNTLPSAAAGLYFTFWHNGSVDKMRVTAAAGDLIQLQNRTTAIAGYIETSLNGSVVTVVAENPQTWVVTTIHGAWTDGTFTFDDTVLITG